MSDQNISGANFNGQTEPPVIEDSKNESEARCGICGGICHRALKYGRENPGKTTLIALGAGLGAGLFFLRPGSFRSRSSRYAKPIVNALYVVAREFFS